MRTPPTFVGGFRSAGISLRATIASLMLGAVLLEAGVPAGTTNALPRFRFAVSSSLFSAVNENDAKAAVKVWARTAIEADGIPVESDAVFVDSTEEMIRAFQKEEIDAASMTSEQFVELSRQVRVSDLFAEAIQAEGGDVFLLLVPTASPIRTLADLKGRTLLMFDHARANLGLPWLDVLLVKEGLPPAGKFFDGIARKKKATAVVLPVFFGAQEVCLIPKTAFDTMVELNPQLGQKLRPLARSPRYVTGVCCLRANYDPANRERIVDSFIHMGKTVAGRQILTVFQSSLLTRFPDSHLDSVRELLAEHARLVPASAPPVPAASSLSTVNSH